MPEEAGGRRREELRSKHGGIARQEAREEAEEDYTRQDFDRPCDKTTGCSGSLSTT